MRQLPDSLIVVKNGSLDDALLRDALIARFVAHGMAPIASAVSARPRAQEHLAAFADIDIALDPFPQNGGVSTWESLQAGVPRRRQARRSAASRAAGAIVTAVGLGDWVAEDDDGYIAIARDVGRPAGELATAAGRLPRARRELGGRQCRALHAQGRGRLSHVLAALLRRDPAERRRSSRHAAPEPVRISEPV